MRDFRLHGAWPDRLSMPLRVQHEMTQLGHKRARFGATPTMVTRVRGDDWGEEGIGLAGRARGVSPRATRDKKRPAQEAINSTRHAGEGGIRFDAQIVAVVVVVSAATGGAAPHRNPMRPVRPIPARTSRPTWNVLPAAEAHAL